MRVRKKIFFGTTSVVVFSLLTLFVSIAGSQQISGDKAGSNDVNVCVGSDSVLRSPDEKTGFCPKGTEQLTLAKADVDKLDETDENDPLGPTKKEKAELDQQLDALEKRVEDLEKAPLFEVVDKTGRLIFSVAPGRVQLYNDNRTSVAGMLATSDGGEFVARSSDRNLSTFLGAYGERAGLRISEGGQPRLDLLKQAAGNYSLRVRYGDGDIAGIGESRSGSGALVIGDKGGEHKAAMQVDDGKGAVNIYNSDGRGVALLTQAKNGGGLLVLTDANSNARVMMGNNDNRYGVVMTFPSGFPYVPKSGLPGSYMLGCAAGSACVP